MCPVPSTIMHGNSDAQNAHGYRYMDTVMYTCNEGYVVNGTSNNSTFTIQCTEDAEWSADPPLCIRKWNLKTMSFSRLPQTISTNLFYTFHI